jgi:hypothetical protein
VSDTVLNELRYRDAALFWIGCGMLLTLVVATLLSISDSRLILGINPWIKPMKFLTSITIFLWSVAWYMPETIDRPRLRAIVRWVIGPAMIVEIACIILQVVRGTTSHFNIATAFDGMVFNIMGQTILLNTLAMVLFACIIRRDTPPQRTGYLWGIRAGVAIFLLASLEGVILIINGAHTVGGPDGGAGLPFVNWSTQHGDLRVAHFFGMHAMQALPLIGFLMDHVGNPFAGVTVRRNLVLAAGIIWVAVMGGVLMMALQGRPLLAL